MLTDHRSRPSIRPAARRKHTPALPPRSTRWRTTRPSDRLPPRFSQATCPATLVGPSDLLAAGSPAGLAGNGRPIAALAAELANSGRLESAIELLDGARQSARCRRDRFIRQLEVVELCLEAG